MDEEILNKLAAIPGVSSVSFSTEVPMDGRDSNDVLFAQDHVYGEGELPPIRRFKFISPGYFATLGTQMIAGRDLTWTDTYQKRPVAIISENFARQYWHDANDALGKRIRPGKHRRLARDRRSGAGHARRRRRQSRAQLRRTGPSCWTVSRGKSRHCDANLAFTIRSPRAGSRTFMNEVQERVWSVNPDVPLADVSTLGELYTKSMARTSFTLVMLCVAGSMALLLGIVGIYGVISYSVSQRTREIGIRMALGAQRETLTALFVRQGLWLTGIGAACGLVVAFVTMRLMSSLLFNVSPVDPMTYITITREWLRLRISPAICPPVAPQRSNLWMR